MYIHICILIYAYMSNIKHLLLYINIINSAIYIQGRCHIILRPHPKNRPRLSRDNKIDDISLNTHTNRFKFKPHITSMYIHICGKKQPLIML